MTLSLEIKTVFCRYNKTILSKKYGVDLPRFTHKSTSIIYASTKEDDTIRYHSLHDNKYLCYFKGHVERVVSLEMSPTDDGFLSGSLDRTVRLWDLRTPHCRGLLHLPSSSHVPSCIFTSLLPHIPLDDTPPPPAADSDYPRPPLVTAAATWESSARRKG